jgi:hypothetical protein
LVAGLVARWTEQPVLAGVDGDVVLGGVNTTASTTVITNSAANDIGQQLICTRGSFGWGLQSFGSQLGVYGLQTASTAGGAGVLGAADGVNTSAVRTGTGVHGQSTSGNAVLGQISASSSASTIAIYAQNYSTYAGPGPAAGGFAIYGLCAKGHGLVGATATAGGAAVVGSRDRASESSRVAALTHGIAAGTVQLKLRATRTGTTRRSSRSRDP